MTASSPPGALAPGVNPGATKEDDTHSSSPKTQAPEVFPVFNKEKDRAPEIHEVYPLVNKDKESPTDRVDYRTQGGPLLSYISCDNELLSGESLYLGAELGSDNRIYFVPGNAARVMVCDPETDKAEQIGPSFVGEYKWCRAIGVKENEILYGLPCNSDSILRIHVPTQQISSIPIPYEEFYTDPLLAEQQRKMEGKYHGGGIVADGCIYAIPQNAWHVLQIDPVTEKVSFVGPRLQGRFKWYGGVAGSQDGAIYCVPHNSAHVLRIGGGANITLHGDFGLGEHKWHGAAASPDGPGSIVCVPANANTILVITPGDPEPVLLELGDAIKIRTGRHRNDGDYKYLGGLAGPNGKVYCFPGASEEVLQVDTQKMTVRPVGPNIYDESLERLCQNKWQNGVASMIDKCVYAIPLAAESLLRIDCSKDSPEVTTWHLPSPYKGQAKWEGGVVARNGVIYTICKNFKGILRIEPRKPKVRGKIPKKVKKPHQASEPSRDRGKANDHDGLVYRSGIPTLRSSAHRVKFSLKNRKHDPRPQNRAGEETNTIWLPEQVRAEDVFSYDRSLYNLQGVVAALLRRCNDKIVGCFPDGSDRLEDFSVPPPSVWRSVNGGNCEDAQKYLSDEVMADEKLLEVFDRLVKEVALPHLKRRLVSVNAVSDEEGSVTFYYQSPPTLRLQPGPAWASVKPHNDAEYGHQNGELNFWLPLTDRTLTGVDLWCETEFKADDYHPVPAKTGEMISFHGSSCRHYVNANTTPVTRMSMDFRVGVEGFFDPYWQMRGTTHDHGRQEVTI
jgi:hypothetical protein